MRSTREDHRDSIGGKSFFCSWSGGKDACLALYLALQKGATPEALLTMLREDGQRSRAHGLPVSLFREQALALGIPLVTVNASWDDYERRFTDTISEFKREGIAYGVFGDIDLESHLEWVERVCSSVRIQVYEPLWKTPRRDLLNQFFHLGFKAMIIAVKKESLDSRFLGRTLNHDLVTEMENAGIDASGEEGEYHTVVTHGPIFHHELVIKPGEHILRDGYHFLDVSVVSTDD